MGKKFGNLQKLTGIITYSLSPNELKPFKGLLNPGLKNVVRRVTENLFYVGVPGFLLVTIYSWAKKTHHDLHRKDLSEFKDDV